MPLIYTAFSGPSIHVCLSLHPGFVGCLISNDLFPSDLPVNTLPATKGVLVPPKIAPNPANDDAPALAFAPACV